MPDGAIVDAHLHLWDPTRFRMPWLDAIPLLNKPYGLPEYRAHTDGIDVASMVYLQVEVEPAYALLETQWVEERIAEDPRIRAIVAWAPLENGELARSFLDEMKATSPHLRGIRRIIQFEPDMDFCLQPDFVRGVQLLADYDLSFDICIDHRHFPNTIKLIRQCPNVPCILDHIGKPNIKEHMLDPWRAHIAELAELPNVVCKISGMVTEADHRRWTQEDLRPFLEHVMEVFGEDRVVFGGDWPVAFQAAPYRRWVDTLDALTVELGADAREKLWAANARRFYRLPPA